MSKAKNPGVATPGLFWVQMPLAKLGSLGILPIAVSRPFGVEPIVAMTTERPSPPRPRCRSLTGVRVLGTGSYVPDAVVTNDHLHQRLGFDSDWIVKRTGILERRHALPHQATSDLCHEAAQPLHRAGRRQAARHRPACCWPPSRRTCRSRPRPAWCRIGCRLNCPAVDMQAACAGFMYALITGAAYVVSGASDLALIIGGDCNSRIVNPDDIKTYPLFGDGAGAVLLARGRPDQGILSYSMGADGSGGDLLSRPACGSRLPPTPELLEKGLHYMYMDGRAVFRWAVAILCDTIQDVLDASGLTPDDVDLYIPHQANIRIINAAIDVLHIPRSRVFNNLDRYGNTSAGSIPLALDEAMPRAGSSRAIALS